MRLDLFERDGRRSTAGARSDELRSDRRAHFEYAQRTPIEGLSLAVA